MPSCLPRLFMCGKADKFDENILVRPGLTKISSPKGSYATNSLSRSPDCASPNGPIVWSADDSPNWSLQRDYLKLQAEKNSILNENVALRNHGADLLALIEFDQNETALLKEELVAVKSDLGNALARNMKLQHPSYFNPLDGIFNTRSKVKEAELKVRRLSVQAANEEFTTANLRAELHKCREERDQAKDMLDVVKLCTLRNGHGSKHDSLFTLEIKASALLHQARYMSKAHEETRSMVQQRINFMAEGDE